MNAVPMSALHELACAGPTPDSGCVCVNPPARRRPSIVAIHLDAADETRKRSEDLVTGVEALISKLTAMPTIPLDVLDRYERVLVQAHASNQVRVHRYSDAALLALDES